MISSEADEERGGGLFVDEKKIFCGDYDHRQPFDNCKKEVSSPCLANTSCQTEICIASTVDCIDIANHNWPQENELRGRKMEGNNCTKEETQHTSRYAKESEGMSSGNARNDRKTKNADKDPSLVSMEKVGLLMREQDAELLESIHFDGPNASGSIPLFMTSKGNIPETTAASPAEPTNKKVLLRKRSKCINNSEAAETPVATSKHSRSGKRDAEKKGSGPVTGGAAIDDQVDNDDIFQMSQESLSNKSFVRRALSGEVWVKEADTQQQGVVPLNLDQARGETNGQQRADDECEPQNCPKELLERTESRNRRLSEAVQFAEVVGELPDTERDDLRIIDEDRSDDDDDDDDDDENPGRGIRLNIQSSPGCENDLSDPETVVVDDKEVEVIRPKKKRPQWPPFQGQVRSGFLDKLPDTGNKSQDFVYKGICSNPPEIVKRGTARGNYAQLHRKAWLEVSDKYHRYGKHLRLYYRYWERLGFPTNMFFDWLDSKAEAAGQPLPELDECPRSKLDSDTVLYITNPEITEGYVVKFVPEPTGSGLVTDVDGDPVRTGPDGWIFVLRDNVMYAAQKVTTVTGHSKQRFHHSSFFGGKAVAAAGIFITDDNGYLTRLYPHSGHYRPGEAHLQRVLFFLYHEGVDLRTFDMDTQQIIHVARDTADADKTEKKKKVEKSDKSEKKKKVEKSDKSEKKKKVESLQLMPAVLVACFLAHKARFIGEGIFSQIHRIRQADVTSVGEALHLVDGS